MSWLLAVLGAIGIAPFLREALRPRMNAQARRSAPGAFAALPQGLTHYRWLGAADGPIAVCVHGLTTPSPVWDAIADTLGDMGYRVLVYDLYGRGYSDRARGPQDADFFARQLSDLLEDQGIESAITLLGYSMGAVIAPRFAAQHPARVRQMALLAPAGVGHDLGPAARLMANTGILGTWAMLLVYARSLRRALEAERGQPSAVPDIVDIQIAQTRHRGFLPAVLSSLRHTLDTDCEADHRALAEAETPLLAIWAEEDEVIPIAGRETLNEWNPAARQSAVPGAGHALPYSHAAEVGAILRRQLAD
ncbi:Pimeloyl-ACP methyl ester carboxylesterase [Roseovarius nanhaiticus]|uniref:Pimeloyl-ACP methyl ester carboxylesterase n=1 Tax=Roseovarius nanhaiticus TaxID=573024 RepID=A0A1N7FD93_9RHOB|nr:alpha/beta fold hydrolase [Roseovarius nanhaiticus]SEK57106.1 Pimeloyl-ACP methyl ester carboxylesterase [Roseovarius nanhaiticus]SIR98283.1 Pimeloyl-ACP methyl ester carboxylesterase [Roseovarius nanhaiticus]